MWCTAYVGYSEHVIMRNSCPLKARFAGGYGKQVDFAPHNTRDFRTCRCVVRLKFRSSVAYTDPRDHLVESFNVGGNE